MTATAAAPLRSRVANLDIRGKRLAYVTAIAATQWSFLRGQNGHMSGAGLELHAIASPAPLLERLRERDGVVVHAVPIARTLSPIADLRSFVLLVATLRRVRPDILHVSTPKAALLGALAGAMVRVPSRVYVVRGLATENASGLRRRLYRFLERLTARLCHETVCVSPSLLRFAQREGIVADGDGVVVGAGMSNGIDSTRFCPRGDGATSGPMVIGYVGRLTRDKGIEDLEAAWQRIRESYPTTRLLLVGPWEHEDAVDPACRRRLEADPRVTLTGGVDDPRPYYQQMDVFAFPSHGTEGFPNAPMEAAATGVPVIATNVVGCVDAVVDGETGLLVPPRDPAALESGLRRYLDDPTEARAHGRRGRERVVAEFHQTRIWEGLLMIYRALIARREEDHP